MGSGAVECAAGVRVRGLRDAFCWVLGTGRYQDYNS